MDPENMRQSIDDRLSKMGYVHPDDKASNQQSVYSVYSEKEGDPYVASVYDPYKTFSSDMEREKIELLAMFCPVCKEKAVLACDCDFKDRMCKNDHTWYMSKEGKTVVGDPHD